MIDIAGLNPEQREAVTTVDGSLMILAGAGTGKTRVITYRIGHMIDKAIPARNIVAMTFTNKAAREMKERLIDLVGEAGKGVKVGTFHSFCLFILRLFPEEAGIDKKFNLVGTSDQIDLVRRGLDEKGWSGLYKADEMLGRISKAKNAMLYPSEVASADSKVLDDEDPILLAEVYELYERQLQLNRVIDFDDCIFRVAKLLKSRKDICERLQADFTHFLVDEFQDTNFSQLYILELLATKHNNICVVGDDDQSIYSWRGAMIETLDRFEKIFPDTKLVKLEQNYRCTNIILDAANSVIRNNSYRKDKTLWSQNKSDEYITLAAKEDDGAEARWIGEKIFTLLGQGKKAKDVAILYRANNQSRALEIALRELNIPYKIFGGSSFFEKKEVKDFLAYFRLSINPNDRMSFWRVINTPSRGIGIKTLERIEEAAKEFNISPFEVIDKKLVKLNKNAEASLEEFVDTVRQQSSYPIMTLDHLEKRGNEIINGFGLVEDIRQKTKHDVSRRKKVEALKKLPNWIKQVGEYQVEDKGHLNLIDLLDQLSMNDDNKNNNENQIDNFVSLMTIHGSKGLEFPNVFLCGLEEELLPHKNSLDDEANVAEERRLFYVAITRAKEKLFISLAKERYSNFKKSDRKPSRFLKEMPDEGVVSDGALFDNKFEQKEERKAKNIRRLGSLKDKLKSGFKD